jgi:putative acetyltransferase
LRRLAYYIVSRRVCIKQFRLQGRKMKSLQSKAVTILSDCDGYAAEIAGVVEAAFRAQFGKADGEAGLIAMLQNAGEVVADLVAVEDGAVAGYAMFSRMLAEPAGGRFAALGPVCARIDRRKAGIGGALIRAGLDICREQGIGAVVVFGDPGYYSHFGFSAAKVEGIACAFAGPHLQALELVSGALAGVTALAYAPAFSGV